MRTPGITPEITAKICAHLEIGTPRKYACAAAGVNVRTFNDWCQKGAEGREPYAGFLAAVEEAEANLVKDLSHKICKHESWQSAAWLLERRAGDSFAKKERVEHSGAVANVNVSPDRALDKGTARELRRRVLGVSSEELRDIEDQEQCAEGKWGLE